MLLITDNGPINYDRLLHPRRQQALRRTGLLQEEQTNISITHKCAYNLTQNALCRSLCVLNFIIVQC